MILSLDEFDVHFSALIDFVEFNTTIKQMDIYYGDPS